MARAYRYAAFISYAHADRLTAFKLLNRLEGYRIPRALGRFNLTGPGKYRQRIAPVFIDRDILSSGPLRKSLAGALDDAAALIVLCTPASAASDWVADEVGQFIAAGRRDRIFCVIADGEPNASLKGAPHLECFPAPLRRLEKDTEFVAGDMRREGDGLHRAVLKVVAGIAGVPFADLLDRHGRRSRTIRRLWLAFAGVSLAGAALAVVVASHVWRDTLAGKRRDEIEASVRASMIRIESTANAMAWAAKLAVNLDQATADGIGPELYGVTSACGELEDSSEISCGAISQRGPTDGARIVNFPIVMSSDESPAQRELREAAGKLEKAMLNATTHCTPPERFGAVAATSTQGRPYPSDEYKRVIAFTTATCRSTGVHSGAFALIHEDIAKPSPDVEDAEKSVARSERIGLVSMIAVAALALMELALTVIGRFRRRSA